MPPHAKNLSAATTIAARWVTRAARTFTLRLVGGVALGFVVGLASFLLLRAIHGDAASWLWLPLLLVLGLVVLGYVAFGYAVRGAARVLLLDSGLVRSVVQRVHERGVAAIGQQRLEGVRGLLGSAMQPLYRALLARFGVEPSLLEDGPATGAERFASDWIALWRRGREWLALAAFALLVVLLALRLG